MYFSHIDAYIRNSVWTGSYLFGLHFVVKNLILGGCLSTRRRAVIGWESRVATRIVFYICWVRETGVDAISAYLKVKLVLPRSLRLKVLKRSKNAITIEVVTFKFGYLKIPLCNFEFNCRQIDNNHVQLRDYFLATYGSIAFFVTRSFCEHNLTCKDP